MPKGPYWEMMPRREKIRACEVDLQTAKRRRTEFESELEIQRQRTQEAKAHEEDVITRFVGAKLRASARVTTEESRLRKALNLVVRAKDGEKEARRLKGCAETAARVHDTLCLVLDTAIATTFDRIRERYVLGD